MSEIKRFRVTVPSEDVSVIKWCESQYNLSFSIRALIKNAIACNGYADATCVNPGDKLPGTSGRPRKSDIENADMIFAKAEHGALFNGANIEEQEQIMMSDVRLRGENYNNSYDMNSMPQGNPQQPVNNNYYQQQTPQQIPQAMQNPQPVNPSVNQPMNPQPVSPVNNNYNQPPAQQQMPMQPDNQQMNTQQMPVTTPPVNNNTDDDDDMAVFNFGR